jgi:signal peptidase I
MRSLLDRHVCPECGALAGKQPFCDECGRNLGREQRLPSRREWERSHPEEAAAKAQRARQDSRRRRRVLAPLLIVLGAIAILAVVVVLARHTLHTLTVPSGSMEPTLPVGAHVHVEMSTKGPLGVGQVVLVHPPRDYAAGCANPRQGGEAGGPDAQACGVAQTEASSETFIKRVVAGPGDTLAMRDGHVIRNGRLQHEPFTAACGSGIGCDFPQAITVPPGEYYTLGDNRGSSDDSRFWGPVPRAWIVAKATDCSFFNVFCSDAYSG